MILSICIYQSACLPACVCVDARSRQQIRMLICAAPAYVYLHSSCASEFNDVLGNCYSIWAKLGRSRPPDTPAPATPMDTRNVADVSGVMLCSCVRGRLPRIRASTGCTQSLLPAPQC